MNTINRQNAIKAYERQKHGGIFMKIFKKDLMDSLQMKIEKFNMELNEYDYGIVVNYKPIIENIDFKKYRTLSLKEFEDYKLGTCWDYTEYEAYIFSNKFGMQLTTSSKLMDNKYFSMYYMQHIDKDGDLPSHTWIGYKLENKIYSFESAWKDIQGVKNHSSENAMMLFYIQKQEEYYKSKNNRLYEYEIVKYTPMPRYGLDPDEFMEIIYNTGNVVKSTLK